MPIPVNMIVMKSMITARIIRSILICTEPILFAAAVKIYELNDQQNAVKSAVISPRYGKIIPIYIIIFIKIFVGYQSFIAFPYPP